MGFSLDLYLLHGSFFPLFFSLSMSKNNSVLLLLTWCSRELAEVKVVPDSGLEANISETGGGGTEDAPSGISTSKTSMFISQSEKSESVLKKKKEKEKLVSVLSMWDLLFVAYFRTGRRQTHFAVCFVQD